MIRKFGKIQAFKNVLKLANKNNIGIVEYLGTVKLHGSNGAVVIMPDKTLVVQSRNRVLTSIQDDNAGFYAFIEPLTSLILEEFTFLDGETVVVYGEWCGGNIASNVALNKLPKMFVVFDIVIVSKDKNEPSEHLHINVLDYNIELLNNNKIYLSTQFQTWSKSVDFLDVKSVQEFATYAFEETEKVDKLCPVGNSLGVSGVGEGIVWSPYVHDFNYEKISLDELKIKTKGQSHSVNRVKQVIPLTEEEFVEQTKLQDFVNTTITLNRVEQACREVSVEIGDFSKFGDVMRWIISDIKEEEKDLIERNNINFKLACKKIPVKVKEYFV